MRDALLSPMYPLSTRYKKHEKDGTMKSTWGNKKSQGKPFNKKIKGKAFTQLAKTISKLEKALKKSSRASSKKKKRHYDSDGSTDSE